MQLKPLTFEQIHYDVPVLINYLKCKGSIPSYNGELQLILLDYWETKNIKKKISPGEVRKLINYIRSNSLLNVQSSNNGYWCSEDSKEALEMAVSLRSRASSIISAAEGLEKWAKQNEEIKSL